MPKHMPADSSGDPPMNDPLKDPAKLFPDPPYRDDIPVPVPPGDTGMLHPQQFDIPSLYFPASSGNSVLHTLVTDMNQWTIWDDPVGDSEPVFQGSREELVTILKNYKEMHRNDDV